MKGYSRYERLVADWAAAYIKPIHEAHQRGEQLPKIHNSFFEKAFRGFIEISSTVEALRLTQAFVSLTPPKSRRIKKPDYLKYHVGVYLQEIYILKERLNAYATKIQRAYSKSSRKNLAEARITPLFEVVKTAVDGLVLTRGAHVHDIRYSDEDLDRVSMFSLVSDANEEFEDAFRLSYKLAKTTWSKRIKDNNEATMKLLDTYFDELYAVITIDGEIHAP
jgi:hypothetical protein